MKAKTAFGQMLKQNKGENMRISNIVVCSLKNLLDGEKITAEVEQTPRETEPGIYALGKVNMRGLEHLQKEGLEVRGTESFKDLLKEKFGMTDEMFDGIASYKNAAELAAEWEVKVDDGAGFQEYNRAVIDAINEANRPVKADSGKKDAHNIAQIIAHLNKGVAEEQLIMGLSVVVGDTKATALMEAAKAQIQATPVSVA